MLRELRIQNLAVIEQATARFGPGLNAVTGETGAGKSVLLAALSLALGNRGDPGLVRAGSERGVAAAVFGDVGAAGGELLAGLAIPDEDVLVLTREVSAAGRSVARINSAVAPATTLRELGDRLLEVHGQGSSSRWLREAEQRAGLDGFGGEAVLAARARVAELWDRREQQRSELERLTRLRDLEQSELERAELDLAELRPAGLRSGEDLELRHQRERLAHGARLRQAAQLLHEAVGGDDGPGAAEHLAAALQGGRGVRGLDPELDSVLQQAEEIVTVLQELELQLGSYLDHLPDDASRLAEAEERLAWLERLARRYGGSLEAAIQRRDEAAAMLEERGGLALDLGRLEHEAAAVARGLAQGCADLSGLRVQAASRLQEAVTEDLHSMLMPHARFLIRIWQREDAAGVAGPDGSSWEGSRDGWDRVSFDLAANSGDQPRPLADAASGGELARVALALLARLSHQSGVGTVVFDEIDQGLGGEAANRVGELLRKVAETRQVICVTHLAPIAARAGTHLRVVKSDRDGKAQSEVDELAGTTRVDELARLLAGEATPAAAREHAAELLSAVGG
ncbi:MAG: DNA repair protein RecN [Candidatus Dormibacteria bacterium]